MNYYRITRVITPAESLALVTLDQAKAALGLDPSDTSQDALLTQQISSVSLAISNWCDRIFAVQGYQDQIRNAYGCLGEPLVTRQYPILADPDTGLPLVEIVEDGVIRDPTALEVYLETGSIYRLDGTALVPAAWGSAQLIVDYTAGYDPVPPDVQGACLEWLTVRWSAVGQTPGLRSETIPDLITQVYTGGSDSSTSATAMPAGVRDWLTPYVMWTV